MNDLSLGGMGQRAAAGIALGLAGFAAGCPGVPGTLEEGTLLADGNRDGFLTGPLGKTPDEPNDTFSDSIAAVFDDEGVARLQGTVATVGDLDVFRLGALSPGDRVIIDVDTTGSPLDVSVAVFDARGRLVVNNDDREGDTSRFLDSYIDWITRHAADPYYLVVTHSAFAAAGRFTGSYRLDVEVIPGAAVPATVGQILLLNFDGGAVDSPVLGSMTLKPLDAADISETYRGQTDRLKQFIREAIEQNFARFNVIVLTTDDGPPPGGAQFSTIHFGGFNRIAFGISENVDLYNVDYCDDSLIFVESFEPRVFSFTPTVEELGRAIGNVASHEAGHLLGLNHVSDDRALMDDQSAADAFIEDQEFMEAPLSRDIMPIGTQDAVLLLNEIVGPSESSGLAAGELSFVGRWPR